MRVLNGLFSWIYIFATLLLGLALILSANGWYGVRDSIEVFISEQLYGPSGIWTGAVLMALGLLLAMLRLRGETKVKTISFDNPEGEVSISIKAIEDFVRKVGQEFAQVKEMAPSICSAGDGIKIKVKTVLIAGANVPKLAESVQQAIKSRIQNVLGIENVSSVEIHVAKIIMKEGPADDLSRQPFDAE